MLFYLVIFYGFGSQFLYPQKPEFNNQFRAFSLFLLIISTINFNRNYFRVKTLSKYIKWGYDVAQWGLLALFILWLPLYNIYNKHTIVVLSIMYLLTLIHIVAILITLIKVFKRQRRDALFYITAFSFLILASIANILIEFGLINETQFIQSPILYGVITEIVVLSLGLVYRYKNLYYEKASIENDYTNHLVEMKKLNEQNIQLKTELKSLSKKEKTKQPFITIGKSHVQSNQIKYIMVNGRYSEIYLTNKENPILERTALKDILSLLNSESFLRIHRSIAVNIDQISKLQLENVVLNTGEVLPVGRSFKKTVQDAMQSLA
jgi:hypothetical protein